MPREHYLLYLDRYGKNRLSGEKVPKPENEEQVMCKAGVPPQAMA